MIREAPRLNPTIHIPQWDTYDDPPVAMLSPFSAFSFNGFAGGDHPLSPSPILDFFPALHRYLPSNEFDSLSDDIDSSPDSPMDAFSCDEFRMYEFKVRKCLRGRAHDWTDCPFAHPGEKAQRRDPRKYHYSGTPCPEFRKGSCRKGDACEYAHGVFECWLHPSRYRTQPCKDGTSCRRRVCFFAHTPEQLRVLTQHDSFSGGEVFGEFEFETSPVSRRFSILISPPVSPPSGSPPMSPAESHIGSYKSSLVASMRKLQLEKSKISGSLPSISGFGSHGFSSLRPGVNSTPTTPTRTPTRSGLGGSDFWDCFASNEDPVMERVESGKELRTKLYAKLSKENSLGRVDSVTTGPDDGWVSELLK